MMGYCLMARPTAHFEVDLSFAEWLGCPSDRIMELIPMMTQTRRLSVSTLWLSAWIFLFTAAIVDAGQPMRGGEGMGLAPDISNIAYGDDPFNVLDLWKAKSDNPTPLVIFIHGGGFSGGDKRQALQQ